MISQFSVRQKDRHQIISALADLTARLFEADVMSEMSEGLMSWQRMEIDRVNQRPVDVEDCSEWHRTSVDQGVYAKRVPAQSSLG